jgi:hypothetical protein
LKSYQLNQKTITNKSQLPARCLKGIPASTSAAHAAFIAHGRSYILSQEKQAKDPIECRTCL